MCCGWRGCFRTAGPSWDDWSCSTASSLANPALSDSKYIPCTESWNTPRVIRRLTRRGFDAHVMQSAWLWTQVIVPVLRCLWVCNRIASHLLVISFRCCCTSARSSLRIYSGSSLSLRDSWPYSWFASATTHSPQRQKR